MKPIDAKHTPGPWRVVERPEQGTANGRRIVVQSPSSIIADCDWNSPATNRANAELIASAPELRQQLDALRAEVAKLRAALTGDRDMLREAAKQFRCVGDKGHAVMCDLHADEADKALA